MNGDAFRFRPDPAERKVPPFLGGGSMRTPTVARLAPVAVLTAAVAAPGTPTEPVLVAELLTIVDSHNLGG